MMARLQETIDELAVSTVFSREQLHTIVRQIETACAVREMDCSEAVQVGVLRAAVSMAGFLPPHYVLGSPSSRIPSAASSLVEILADVTDTDRPAEHGPTTEGTTVEVAWPDADCHIAGRHRHARPSNWSGPDDSPRLTMLADTYDGPHSARKP